MRCADPPQLVRWPLAFSSLLPRILSYPWHHLVRGPLRLPLNRGDIPPECKPPADVGTTSLSFLFGVS
jgi:hypothetical protein